MQLTSSAGREQHVELARVGSFRDLVRKPDQVVGGVAHGGYDRDDAVAGVAGLADAAGDAHDRLESASELPPYFCTISAKNGLRYVVRSCRRPAGPGHRERRSWSARDDK